MSGSPACGEFAASTDAGLSQRTALAGPKNRGTARRYMYYSVGMSFVRKTIRLAPTNYVGFGIYFVTVCCHQRTPYFTDSSFAHFVLNHLARLSAKHCFSLPAFCLMPDHLHFLAKGESPDSNLLAFVTAFKQRTTVAHKNRAEGTLWQAKFYDHILRKPQDLEAVALYIWANPVRRGLCEDAAAYAFSGSQMPDWKKLCGRPSPWKLPWKA